MNALKSRQTSLIRHCGVLLALSVALPAVAQKDLERSAAREAAGEGVALLDGGRYAEAIDKLTRAESLYHAPTQVLYLARAYEKAGKLAKARELYLKLKAEPLDSKAPKAFVDAQHAGAAELESLEPRVPRLRVRAAENTAETVVLLLDGQELPAALIDVPIPLDPGEHRAQLRTAERESDEAAVSLVESKTESVELALTRPRTTATAVAQADADSAVGGPKPAPPTTRQPPSSPRTNPLRIGSYVALGVGALGLGAGTYFLFRGRGKDQDSVALFNKYECDSRQCSDGELDDISLLDDSRDSAYRLSLISYVIGGLAVAGGATLYVLSSPDEKRGASVRPYLTTNSVGFYGRF